MDSRRLLNPNLSQKTPSKDFVKYFYFKPKGNQNEPKKN